jgi:hypothetical protein
VEAQKPAWQTGSTAPLKLRWAAEAVNGKPKMPEGKKSWNISAGDEDEELLDDDELLTEEDLQRPAPSMASGNQLFFLSLSTLTRNYQADDRAE